MTASLPRFALRSAIVLGAVCTLGLWPVSRWQSTQGLVAWSVAFAVVLLGAILGALPLASKFARRSPENFPQAWMIGFGLRMLLVLTACLVVWTTRPFPPNPFLLGAGIAYGVVLAIEIATASRMLRTSGPSSATDATPPADATPVPHGDSHSPGYPPGHALGHTAGDWAR